MQPDVAKRLLDALQAIRRIRKFTHGLDRQKFTEGELVRASGEAVCKPVRR
jgi:uncharacterized protein with HEPN domain